MTENILQQRIQMRLDALKQKASRVSVGMGKSDSFIRDILRGKTAAPNGANLIDLANALETSPEYLLGMTDDPKAEKASRRTTRIVGRGGASTDGRILMTDGEMGLGEVEIPEGATEDSVAIEIDGYSQGFIADGCLIFFTEVHAAPTDDMLGTIVVVGTDDGEVLLKKLLRGSRPGLYDLESINGPMLRDRRVLWAAHVDSLVPPWRARRLRVDASEIKL